MPRIAHEALVSWLTSLLFGGFFKERYAAQIRQAVEIDGSAFRQTLMEVAGRKLGLRLWQAAVDGHAEISAEWTRSLRLAVWRRACLRSPVRTIRRFVAYVVGELRLRFAPPVPWITILGPDGDEKSSLANEVAQRFAACPYGNVTASQWHPRLMSRPQGNGPGTDPDERPARRPIGSAWRLLVLAADWTVCYWTRWVHLRAKGYVLASDRTYFDVVAGHMRDSYGAVPRLGRALWWLVPKPDLVFVLDSEPDAPVHRAWAQPLPPGHVFDGSAPLSAAVDAIQRVVRAWMSNRSIASLGAQVPIVAVPAASTVDPGGAPASVSRGEAAR